MLSEPSNELATKLLSKVDFDRRLTGYIEHPMSGVHDVDLYSFEGVVNFLEGCRGDSSLGELLANVSLLNGLKNWIKDTLGDEELAQAIEEEAQAIEEETQAIEEETKGNYDFARFRENAMLIIELMRQRLNQCKAVLGI